jgi:hypothetical protein
MPTSSPSRWQRSIVERAARKRDEEDDMTRSLVTASVALLILVGITSTGAAQDLKPLGEDPDAHYYDFWPGTWCSVEGGKIDRAGSVFRVQRGVHDASFEETWRQRIDARTVLRARAIRAWDKTAGRWMFVWVSENGLFQVWEGNKQGDRWYIYKEFDIDGERYLSRQGWFPVGPNEVERVSEKSSDQGKTWQLRFRQRYRKANPRRCAPLEAP